MIKMPVDTQKRKRPVAACQPCYSKKQKCDHQYPCSNCVRRRLPELCNYSFSENDGVPAKSKSSSTATSERSPKRTARESQSPQLDGSMMERRGSSSPLPLLDLEGSPSYEANLSSCLGYFEGSKSNLFSLMDKFDLLNTTELEVDATNLIPDTLMPEIQSCLDMFPKRQIINCLVQHFLKEVNWIYEMIHPALFLNKYEQWWKSADSAPVSSVEGLDFGILILRICAYSAQFIPSKTHSGDSILNVQVSTIRQHCEKLATRLWRLCEQLEGPKSLTCVHHLFFQACYVQNEGSMRDAWYILGNAIRVMQDLGIHLEEPLRSQTPLNDLEKDMRRRAFWNLYVWDRSLSLVLDRSPSIPEEHYCSVDLPKMRFPSTQNSNAPDVFTERLLQAKLSKLWFSLIPANKSKPDLYDPSFAEELYEKLCRDFVAQLPPAFSLQDPDQQFDEQNPMLARQRQTLRISVFVILCQLFQPLLHLTSEQISAMPQYKRDLIVVHRDHLVNASVSLLEGVAQLHELMGNTPARFHLLSFFTFEPAMLLAMYIMSTATSSKALSQARELNERHYLFRTPPTTPTLEIPGISKGALNASQCRVHIENALERLTLLQDSSMIAKVSARKLREVLAKLDSLPSDADNIGTDSASQQQQPPPAAQHRGHFKSVSHSIINESAIQKGNSSKSTQESSGNNNAANNNWFGVEMPQSQAQVISHVPSQRSHSQSVSHSRSHSRSRSQSRPHLSRMHSFASMASVTIDSPPITGHSTGRELSTYRPQQQQSHQHQHTHSHSHSHPHPQTMMISPAPSPSPWGMTSPPFTSPPLSFSGFSSDFGDPIVSSAHSNIPFSFDAPAQWPLYDGAQGADEGLGVYTIGEEFIEGKEWENRGLRSDSGVGSVSPGPGVTTTWGEEVDMDQDTQENGLGLQ